ncbi:hypothetical protein D910_06799 [Dendroctonus ponderosae]|uniref:AP180 N-terminal homology (ANTH) domain-containing protein n=1 Tax=Dendroctonus ponderosae TaxID=77166 RepID=U4U8R8_DENPD|nr:hypothetical protein D910_06799 [Dendroctonus ponderosae]
MLEAIDKNETFSINLLDAVNFIHRACQKVSRKTIANFFKHGGFVRKDNDYESDDEIPLNEWLEKHKDSDYEYDSDEDVPNFVEEQVKTKLRYFNFFEYVSIDNGILTRGTEDSVTSSTALSDNEEDLVHCTNEPNVSIPQLANLLIERSQNANWVVVYKALVTCHHMMCYGNEDLRHVPWVLTVARYFR